MIFRVLQRRPIAQANAIAMQSAEQSKASYAGDSKSVHLCGKAGDEAGRQHPYQISQIGMVWAQDGLDIDSNCLDS